jgi:hypothetical protein
MGRCKGSTLWPFKRGVRGVRKWISGNTMMGEPQAVKIALIALSLRQPVNLSAFQASPIVCGSGIPA